MDRDTAFVEEDLHTSTDVRKAIQDGKMTLLTEEEYWTRLSGK